MIACVSDLHFGSKSFNKTILRLQLDFFEKQFFPYVLQKKIKHVLHLGDLVHNRTMIDLYFLDQIKKRFFKWFDDNDVKLHTVVGNHDTYYKTSLHPNFYSENTKEFKNVYVYDEITIKKIDKFKIGFIPWLINPTEAEFPQNVDVLAGHFDIKSFPMQRGINSFEGFDKKRFIDYNLVISGHYHIRSTRNNIHYVGSPYQISWSDFDEDRGFSVLDDDLKVKFIRNKVNPRFLRVYYRETKDGLLLRVGGRKKRTLEEISVESAIEIVKENFVKLIVEKVSNQTAFDDFYQSISSASIGDYKIEIIDIDEMIDDLDYELCEGALAEEGDTIEAVKQYINALRFDQDDVDKKLLLDICQTLHKKALERMVDFRTGIEE